MSETTALELCALPAFPDNWAIVPSRDGTALTLAWGDACTLEELERSSAWNAAQIARLEADRLPGLRA
ncbi:hypothetical protein [Deinococcus sp. UYEF24]